MVKDWFISYLSNRKQFVTRNNISSDQQTVSCGVSQGSVLGPLPLLMYINDFNCCSNLLDFHLFADDVNLFYKNKNISVLQPNLNEELNNVRICLCANKLSLKVEKSNFVMFHPSQKNLTFPIRLLIDDKRLSEKNCIKYLGLMIDCNLNWKCEIKCIAKKIKRNIGIISKLRHYVGQKILANIYYALVYPFSIYGILVWSNSYPSTIQPLFILQKWAMRIISFSKFDAPSSTLQKLEYH